MTAMQNAHHAKCALQCVLQIVITRVDGKVSGVAPFKTSLSPSEGLRNKMLVRIGKNRAVAKFNVSFDGREVLGVNERTHAGRFL